MSLCKLTISEEVSFAVSIRSNRLISQGATSRHANHPFICRIDWVDARYRAPPFRQCSCPLTLYHRPLHTLHSYFPFSFPFGDLRFLLRNFCILFCRPRLAVFFVLMLGTLCGTLFDDTHIPSLQLAASCTCSSSSVNANANRPGFSNHPFCNPLLPSLIL